MAESVKLDLAAFLDRSNIGNAETAGMGEYLGYSDEQYSVGVCSRGKDSEDFAY